MNNYIQSGDILTVTAPADVTSGQLIKVGGIIGVCASDAASGAQVEVQTVGVFGLPKATGFVPAAGDVAFFDFGSDNRLESAGVAVGVYTHSALTGDTQARVKLDPQLANSLLDVITLDLSAIANNTWEQVFPVAFAGKALSGQIVAPDAWSSSLGSVLLTLKKTSDAGNTMLSTATLDLEGVTDETVTALTLTSTAADLAFDAGGKIYAKIVSNNADATVPDLQGAKLQLIYQRAA